MREVASDGNQYPRFKRALKLARDIDVSTSFERIRVLEGVVDSNEQIEFEEGSSRPSKRVRLTPDGEAKAAELAAAAERHEAEALARFPQAAAVKAALRGIIASFDARPRARDGEGD